jgi:ectoine hydroxylase-related dioxygenase (phytanoyl-CoA dioxygenase family)
MIMAKDVKFIDGVLSHEQLDWATQTLARMWATRLRSGIKSLSSVDEFRFHSIHLYSRKIREIAFAPRLIRIVTEILDNDVWLAQSALFQKPPGSVGHQLHQDAYFIQPKGGRCAAVWIALEPTTTHNGCVCLLPGTSCLPVLSLQELTNRLSKDTRTRNFRDLVDGLEYEERQLELTPMSACVWDGNVVHWSMTNHSSATTRMSLVLHFVSKSVVSVAPHLLPLIDKTGAKIVL